MAQTMRKRVIWKDKKDSIFEGYIGHSALNSLNLKRLFLEIIDFKNVEKNNWDFAFEEKAVVFKY